MKLFIVLVVATMEISQVFTAALVNTHDIYIKEMKQLCEDTKAPMACFKYRTATFLSNKIENGDFVTNRTFGFVKLVRALNFPDTNDNSSLEWLGEARQYSDDSEAVKIVKFLKRQAKTLLESYAIKLPIPEDGFIMDEDDEIASNVIDGRASQSVRGRKKKKLYVLFPLLVALKLFKVKVLLIVILFGVLFIKKAIIGAALSLPSLLNMLKICRTPPQHHHEHASLDYAAPHDYPGNYGGYTGYGQVGGGSFGKEYTGYDRVYNAHRPQTTQT